MPKKQIAIIGGMLIGAMVIIIALILGSRNGAQDREKSQNSTSTSISQSSSSVSISQVNSSFSTNSFSSIPNSSSTNSNLASLTSSVLPKINSTFSTVPPVSLTNSITTQNTQTNNPINNSVADGPATTGVDSQNWQKVEPTKATDTPAG
jgi:gas vesicle protein